MVITLFWNVSVVDFSHRHSCGEEFVHDVLPPKSLNLIIP